MPRGSSTSPPAGSSACESSSISCRFTASCATCAPAERRAPRALSRPGAGWEPVEASLVTISLGPPYPAITVNRYLVQKDREQQVVLYWYQSQGQVIAGEVPARIAMVKRALVHNRTDGAIVRVMSPVYGSARETSDRLVAYVQAMYSVLGDYLPD